MLAGGYVPENTVGEAGRWLAGGEEGGAAGGGAGQSAPVLLLHWLLPVNALQDNPGAVVVRTVHHTDSRTMKRVTVTFFVMLTMRLFGNQDYLVLTTDCLRLGHFLGFLKFCF